MPASLDTKSRRAPHRLKHEQCVAAMFLRNIHAPAHTPIDQILLKTRILPVHIQAELSGEHALIPQLVHSSCRRSARCVVQAHEAGAGDIKSSAAVHSWWRRRGRRRRRPRRRRRRWKRGWPLRQQRRATPTGGGGGGGRAADATVGCRWHRRRCRQWLGRGGGGPFKSWGFVWGWVRRKQGLRWIKLS